MNAHRIQYPTIGRIVIPGDPEGKRSAVPTLRGNRAGLRPHEKDVAYAKVINAAIDAGRFGVTWKPVRDPRVPIWVHITAQLVRPPSHFNADGETLSASGREFLAATKKPDTDNISKIVLDTFTHAGVWPDDSQVVDNHQVKVFADEACVIVEWGLVPLH